jgi:hypothetical protein
MSPPPHLYKYESLTLQTLQNLKRQVLYFGSPLKFNDPYDCALVPNIRPPTDAEVEARRRTCLDSTVIRPSVRHDFETFSVGDLREIMLRAWRSAFEQDAHEFLAKRGVACFSESNEDLLMWSHYGGRYTGLCLEFSTTSEVFAKIQRVDYVQTLPTIEPPQIPADFHCVDYELLFCTKSEPWAYEKEWRAFHQAAGTVWGSEQNGS